MERNHLQSISNFADLKGKSLKSLALSARGHNGNGQLTLNLTEFTNQEINIPLKHLQISRSQIAAFFGIEGTWTNQLILRIRTWINGATLESMRIVQGQTHGKGRHAHNHNMFVFYKDGRVMFSGKYGERDGHMILGSY